VGKNTAFRKKRSRFTPRPWQRWHGNCRKNADVRLKRETVRVLTYFHGRWKGPKRGVFRKNGDAPGRERRSHVL